MAKVSTAAEACVFACARAMRTSHWERPGRRDARQANRRRRSRCAGDCRRGGTKRQAFGHPRFV